MSDLIHSQSQFLPRYIPYLNDVDWSQIDRAQNLDPSADFPREKLEELGTDGLLGWVKDVSVVGCRLVQREYGSIDFYNALANKASGTSLTLNDFAKTAGDISAYLTDIDGNASSALWYPRQRLAGFSIAIGDPTALVDRNFEFTGEDAILLQGNNKYLIFKKKTLTAPDIGSGDIAVITLDDPVAIEDPDNAGKFMFRVLRVKAGVTTELVEGTDYTSTANALTVESCTVADVIKYYYSGSSFVTSPSVPFTTNVSDLNGIRANSVVLYLGSANRLYKVQSATLDVRFDREDAREIGSEDVIARSIRNKTVSITLGKLLDTDFTMEEVLRGNTSGKLDTKNYSDSLTFIMAVYSDSGHGTFQIGYQATGLAPTSSRPGTAGIDANVDSGVTLEGEALTIADNAVEVGL